MPLLWSLWLLMWVLLGLVGALNGSKPSYAHWTDYATESRVLYTGHAARRIWYSIRTVWSAGRLLRRRCRPNGSRKHSHTVQRGVVAASFEIGIVRWVWSWHRG